MSQMKQTRHQQLPSQRDPSRNLSRVLPHAMLAGVVFASLLAGGCAASRSAALERAQANFQQAQQNPNITNYAPVALQEAQSSLQRAERVWKEDEDRKEVGHLTYLVERRIEIARATADKKMAEAKLARLGETREQILLNARTRDAQHAQSEAEQAKAQARQLAQELADLKAKQTERGLVLTLGDVLFAYNQAELKPGALQNLYQLVTFLRENPERQVIIEGHTDSHGSDDYNQDLSRRRAEAVRSFLLKNGIPPQRITARGYGEAYPVAPNGNEAGRQQNRRVEVVILKAGERAAQRMR